MGEPVVLVMGVSGSGKTTIGEAIAARTGWPFLDADLLHPQSNIDKMEAGIPLTDADRRPLAGPGGRLDPRAAQGGRAGRGGVFGPAAGLPGRAAGG